MLFTSLKYEILMESIQKISIIGASGNVGCELFQNLLRSTLNVEKLNLFFHSKQGEGRLVGLTNDYLCGNTIGKINITNNIDDLSDSSICIICAGAGMTTDPKANNATINNRNVVFEQNEAIVLRWAETIMLKCPSALVVMVTNPVSKLMCSVLRLFPCMKIVGCGVTNDTMRVRNECRINHITKGIDGVFVVGEHDLSNQSVLLTQDVTWNSDGKIDFDMHFSSEEEKHSYIAELKRVQNDKIIHEDYSVSSSLPILYQSYMRHRLGHFLYKTHVSTAVAIMEIIKAYIYEDIAISVETVSEDSRFVVGVPICFKAQQIEYVHKDIVKNLSAIKKCSNKYVI